MSVPYPDPPMTQAGLTEVEGVSNPEPEDVIACTLADRVPGGGGEVDDHIMEEARAIIDDLEAAGFTITTKASDA